MDKGILRGLFGGASLVWAAWAWAYSTGPDPGYTGAPGEQTCTSCHNSHPLNTGGGSITLTGIPTDYVPGATYTISIQDQKTGQKRWGFEMTAKKADNSMGGTLAILDKTTTQTKNGRSHGDTITYAEHTEAGTALGQLNTGPVWQIQWTAPPSGSGPVTFYAAGNCANGDSTQFGDYIYTTNAASAEGSALPAVIPGDLNGDGKVTVADATLALKIAVGLILPTSAQLAAGDFSGAGKIDVSDAVQILKLAVGL